jgi:hypothetical protein
MEIKFFIKLSDIEITSFNIWRPLKRGSIYMDFSLTRQEKCDLLIQVASTGSFDCIGKENHINFNSN